MADYVPVYGKPHTLSLTAGGAIVGGQLLKMGATADMVLAADANCATYVGVAAHDAASGAAVTVYTGGGIIHETLANAATSVGSLVYAGAASAGELGATNTGYGVAIGVAIRATSTAHFAVRWKSLVG